MGGDETEAISRSASSGSTPRSWAGTALRSRTSRHSINCGVDAVAISMSASDIHIEHKLQKDRKWVLD